MTTGIDPNVQTLLRARDLSARLGLPYVDRGQESLASLRQRHQTDAVVVVGKKGVRIETEHGKPFFFHPNTAAFRIKRLRQGDTDTMLSVCQIQPGDQVLDATLGLGADAIVFAYAVGETGRVVGLESERIIAVLVEDGLRSWQDGTTELLAAMRRVEVVARHHLEFLRSLASRSFDIVYFDPMFHRAVRTSTGIEGLREYANPEPLTREAVTEALRVARRRVVLKEGKGGRLFERLGFTPFRKQRHQVVYSYREAGGGE